MEPNTRRLTKSLLVGQLKNNDISKKLLNKNDIYPILLKAINSSAVDDFDYQRLSSKIKDQDLFKNKFNLSDISIFSNVYHHINSIINLYKKNIFNLSDLQSFFHTYNEKGEIININSHIFIAMKHDLNVLNIISELNNDFPEISRASIEYLNDDFFSFHNEIFKENNYSSFILILVFVEKYLRYKVESNEKSVSEMDKNSDNSTFEKKSLLQKTIEIALNNELITKEESLVFKYFMLKWKHAGLNMRNDFLHGFKGVNDYKKCYHEANIFMKYFYGFLLKESFIITVDKN